MKAILSLLIGLLLLLPANALTRTQCQAACRSGVAAMEKFCRLVPHPAVRAGCWAVVPLAKTPGAITACTNWCAYAFS